MIYLSVLEYWFTHAPVLNQSLTHSAPYANHNMPTRDNDKCIIPAKGMEKWLTLRAGKRLLISSATSSHGRESSNWRQAARSSSLYCWMHARTCNKEKWPCIAGMQKWTTICKHHLEIQYEDSSVFTSLVNFLKRRRHSSLLSSMSIFSVCVGKRSVPSTHTSYSATGTETGKERLRKREGGRERETSVDCYCMMHLSTALTLK